MRTLEWLMALLATPAIVWVFLKRRPWPTWIRIMADLSIGVLIAHAWWEGIHWQMAPIYLALILLVYPLMAQRFPASLASPASAKKCSDADQGEAPEADLPGPSDENRQ